LDYNIEDVFHSRQANATGIVYPSPTYHVGYNKWMLRIFILKGQYIIVDINYIVLTGGVSKIRGLNFQKLRSKNSIAGSP
jgi:hypothetical protein